MGWPRFLLILSHEVVMNKLTQLILILATAYYAQLYLLSYLYLCRTSKLLVCGGWVVKNFTDNKAISAPSWGLAG